MQCECLCLSEETPKPQIKDDKKAGKKVIKLFRDSCIIIGSYSCSFVSTVSFAVEEKKDQKNQGTRQRKRELNLI